MSAPRIAPLLLVACAALPAAAEGESSGAEPLPTLAVLEFAAKGGVSQDSADALADLVASEALGRGTHKVIGKADIKSLIGYEKIKDSLGCEEASCLAEIGGALGVDLILVGNVSKFDEVFLLNLRLIDPGKAEVSARVSRKVPGGQAALLDAVGPAVGELFGDEPQAAVFGVVGALGALKPAGGSAQLAGPGGPTADDRKVLVELETMFERDLGPFYDTWLDSPQRRKGLSFDAYMLEAAHEQKKTGISTMVTGCGLLVSGGALVPVLVKYKDNDVVVGLLGAGVGVIGLLGVVAVPAGALGYVASKDAIEQLTPRVEARTGPAAAAPRTWKLSYSFEF